MLKSNNVAMPFGFSAVLISSWSVCSFIWSFRALLMFFLHCHSPSLYLALSHALFHSSASSFRVWIFLQQCIRVTRHLRLEPCKYEVTPMKVNPMPKQCIQLKSCGKHDILKQFKIIYSRFIHPPHSKPSPAKTKSRSTWFCASHIWSPATSTSKFSFLE